MNLVNWKYYLDITGYVYILQFKPYWNKMHFNLKCLFYKNLRRDVTDYILKYPNLINFNKTLLSFYKGSWVMKIHNVAVSYPFYVYTLIKACNSARKNIKKIMKYSKNIVISPCIHLIFLFVAIISVFVQW